MLTEEAIQLIQDTAVKAADVQVHEQDGRIYTNGQLTPMMEPIHDVMPVHTLTGVADLITARIEQLDPSKVVIVVESPCKVEVYAKDSDQWGRCARYVVAEPIIGDAFKFGYFMPAEEFVIGLASRFAMTDDLAALMRSVSSMTAEAVTTSADDGVSQNVALRSGVVLAERATLKPIVDLAPYRTFAEVQQPVSKFLFRVKQQKDQPPACALFEADGGRWRLDAVQKIKAWLDAKNLGVTVSA